MTVESINIRTIGAARQPAGLRDRDYCESPGFMLIQTWFDENVIATPVTPAAPHPVA
jgi:hypothetical protein